MTDKNGVEMKTGDIVEIKNAYFKNDNGIYFVDNTPGDISWCGRYYSLKKMCKNGKLSTATHNIAFWPLSAFTSNRQKNADCKAWNEQHATIEIIYNIDNAQVIEHFKQNAERLENQIKRLTWDFGENHEVTLKSIETRNHYLSVAERLSKTEEPDHPKAKEVKEEIKPVQVEIREKLLEEPKKESDPEAEENTLFKVVENTDIMRLQLLFDGIPEASTRDVLKKHGFRWSPSNKAWQRLLNDNAKYSLKQIKKELTA